LITKNVWGGRRLALVFASRECVNLGKLEVRGGVGKAVRAGSRAVMLCVQRKRPRLPSIVLVGDPGPDPDDAKALLILGILGLQGVVRLRAVVCNGGGRPELRARLARALLDRIGSPCPVGVGSAGKAHAPSSYEFALTGFDDVDASRLEDGQTLLLRTLRAARDGSLTIVCISSLRDIADVMASEPALLRRKVCEVAVQGGLELDPVTKRYVPDSSTNNGAARREVKVGRRARGLPRAHASRSLSARRAGCVCDSQASIRTPRGPCTPSALTIACRLSSSRATRCRCCRCRRAHARGATTPRARHMPHARQLVVMRSPAARPRPPRVLAAGALVCGALAEPGDGLPCRRAVPRPPIPLAKAVCGRAAGALHQAGARACAPAPRARAYTALRAAAQRAHAHPPLRARS